MSISHFSISFVFFSIVGFPSCYSADQQYEKCQSPLRCGSAVFPNITYPFWGTDIDRPNYCGQSPFKLSCEGNENLTLEIGNLTVRVISGNMANRVLTVADDSWLNGGCPEFWNFTGKDNYILNSTTETIEVFTDCPVHGRDPLPGITCQGSNGEEMRYHVLRSWDSETGCRKVAEIPMLSSVKHELQESNLSLEEALSRGFELEYTMKDTSCPRCSASRGICGSESNSDNFRCLCTDRPHDSSCNDTVTNQDTPKHSTWKIGLIAAGSSLFILVLLFVLILVFLCCKRGFNTEDAQNLIEEEGMSLLLSKVLAATENLDDKYIIGRGAHGVVYRASLESGEEYAVKKLVFAEHARAKQNMRREIETIGLVRHRNLIRLERFWMRKEDGLMLYQYMPNGSLHDVLHRDSTGETVLDWLARFNIALGIAHGLAYLHHDCFPPIIHRDIKPENILLDSDMEPHIGDFGLAQILNDSTVSTATITGTTGYISPENAYKTVRSKDSDVYSYGVVLLELVTGKRALDRSLPEDTDIVSWVRYVLSSNEEDDDDTGAPIIDPRLVHELLDMKLREQAIQVTYLALSCTDKRPENRPSMRDVVKTLIDVKDLLRSTSVQ